MNDLKTLHDAFEELERQADAYPVAADPPVTSRIRPHRDRRLLMAGTVVVVAIATTTAVLIGRQLGTTGEGSAARPAPTVHKTIAAPRITVSSHVVAPTRPKASPPTKGFPRNAAAVAARLHVILGKSTTFTWSAPAGKHAPVIAGVLTDSTTGRQGGFDLQTAVGSPGDAAQCEDAQSSHCAVRRLSDGTSVSVGHEKADGTLYLVNVVRANGAALLMHVSTNSDPKGGGTDLGPTPPLSMHQIVTLLRSPRWRAA